MGKIRLGFLLASLLLLPAVLKAQVVINEYSCSNISDYPDNFNEYEDWIELYNAGGAAVNLGSYFLSDKLANPLKWQIPNINLNPGQRQIIYASNRNLTSGSYHTNFKLSQTINEVIVLSDALGTIIDSVTTRPALRDHSRGRTTDGAGTWSLFTNPTPNQANAGAQTEYPTRPTMSVAAGYYSGSISVALAAQPNTTIRYTTNGTTPTAGSTAYAGPINISSTTVLRARAFSNTPGVPVGFTETNTYFFNVNHTIPVVSVASDNYTNLFSSGMAEIESSLEFFDINQNFQFETFGEVNGHGNDSWAFPQKGIDFITKDEFGYDEEMNYPLFHTSPRPAYQRIMFKAGASDNYPSTWGNGGGHLRDAFIQSLAEKASLEVDLRRFESCILYINGQYWGVYELREKMNDPDYTDFYYGQDKEDIDLLSYWGGLNIRYGSDTGWVNLYNYVMANNMANQASYNVVAATLNIQSIIDYTILNTYTVNSDWMNWNTMWWRGRKSPGVKWKYSLWDMDNIFDLGHNYSGWPTTDYTADPCDLDANFTNAGPNEGHLDIFNALMDNPGFRSQYVNRYSELIQTYLSCPYVLNHFDSIVNILAPEMTAHTARWGGSVAGWQNNLNYIRNQITGRCTVINQGIVDCYSVTGPFPLTVNVDPPGAGDAKVANQLNPNYPWTQNFFGNITIPIEAIPAFGWNFCYWEIGNHIITPDSSYLLAEFLLTTSDSLIAHFCKDDSLTVTYVVMPPGTGDINIGGSIPGAYPHIESYVSGTPENLQAIANTGYIFDTWATNHHALNPSLTTAAVNYTVTQTDTIIAYFVVKPDDPIDPVDPPGPDTLENPTMFVPNSFTPNGDGLNDEFFLEFNDRVVEGTWEVYDRWGLKLFDGEITKGWDGTHNGTVLPIAVYVYHVRYVNDEGEIKHKHGHVTLLK